MSGLGGGGGEEITDFGQNILAKLLLSREPLYHHIIVPVQKM